jgi:hypothetical protein
LRWIKAYGPMILSVKPRCSAGFAATADDACFAPGSGDWRTDDETDLCCDDALRAGDRPLPNGQAPNFETIAKTPGMTAIALTAALRTPHRTMPNVIVADDDLRNVVAYVLSLQ